MTEKGRYVGNRELAVGIGIEQTCLENLMEINSRMLRAKLANEGTNDLGNMLLLAGSSNGTCISTAYGLIMVISSTDIHEEQVCQIIPHRYHTSCPVITLKDLG